MFIFQICLNLTMSCR